GRPLGAVLTHGNLCTQALLFESICQGRHDDIGLAVIPLFHAFGAATNMLGPLSLGASVVMMETFSVDGIFRAIEKEKITYISAVPRLYLAMFMHQGAETRDVSSLRLCMTGGASIPTEFISMFREKFNVKLAEGYGLTEASPVVSFSRLEMTQKPGSVGTPAPGVDVKVVDDDGSELPAGQVGELIVRGPNVMKGYFNEPEATAEVLKGEWLYTGDLARLDDEGYIFLAGLKKRLIITSGFNVYPAEVESILLRHPAVKDAKVVGSPDFMRGEIVKAIVVKREGFSLDDTELIRYCRTYLAPFKTPREVEFVPSMP
ncbi:MAG: AMP-binding protein, partial [Deltaproteobacteria bacterium]|nr:AMP-binding protein [Deltaproteobacteria bacterium]